MIRRSNSSSSKAKIAASKKKGIWVGGPMPLGYAMNDGKVVVVDEEVEQVRLIFASYLEPGSVHALMRDLTERGIVSKRRMLKTGKIRGGVPFGRGALFYLLRNRFYIGEVNYKGRSFPVSNPLFSIASCSTVFSRPCQTSGGIRPKPEHPLLIS